MTDRRKPTDREIRLAYGYCLQLAGVPNASQPHQLNLLLGQDPPMYFTFFIPIGRFRDFATDFLHYAHKQVDLSEWVADKKAIKAPKRAQPAWEHFEQSFRPAFENQGE